MTQQHGERVGRVSGKVALITGAARGQGRSHAIRLAEEGADVIAVDICAPIEEVAYPLATSADLDQTVDLVRAAGRRIQAYQVDVRDVGSLEAAVKEGVGALGGLDIVVANAGVSFIAPWNEVTPEMWQTCIDVNLTGTQNTIRAAVPHIIERGGGSIIIISSVAGVEGRPFLVPYTATKFGITGLMHAYAIELGRYGIRVNSLHPSGVDTPMGGGEGGQTRVARLVEANPEFRGVWTKLLDVDQLPPRDISNVVLFLASDESRYITGLRVIIDAGQSTI